MQIDFHFYGIYFLCRAAGIDVERSKRIAYASQYTDDAKDSGIIKSPDGFEFNTVHTSYGLLRTPFSPKAQREIWLPFHFVPNVVDGDDVGAKIVTKSDLSMVFTRKGNADERGTFWKDLIVSGNQFEPLELDKNVSYDEKIWRDEIVDKETYEIKSGADVQSSHWYRFNEAARWYKTEIIKAVPNDILDAVIMDDDFEVMP